jgi:hypothetical protein
MTHNDSILRALETQEDRERGYLGYVQSVTANARAYMDDYDIAYESLIPKQVIPLHKLVEGKHYTLDNYDEEEASFDLESGLFKGLFEGNYEEVITILAEHTFLDRRSLKEELPDEFAELVDDTYEKVRDIARVFINRTRNQDELNKVVQVLAKVDEVMNALFPNRHYFFADRGKLHHAYRHACSRAEYVASAKLVTTKEVSIAT